MTFTNSTNSATSATSTTEMMTVCWKWTDLRPDLDRLTAGGPADVRFTGISDADGAALAVALQCAQHRGARVRVISAGGPDVERGLRHALASGADEVLRIDLDQRLPSAMVAAAVARVVTDTSLVWCGDYSHDRGTGSFPVFLAAHLGVASALGVVGIDLDGTPLRAIRRLDGGRREVLALPAPAVISVEGSLASLPRSRPADMLRAERAEVPVVPGPSTPAEVRGTLRPFRPRGRPLPPPQGDTALERLRSLSEPAGGPPSGRAVPIVMSPDDAAQRILTALSSWGAYGNDVEA